MTDKYQRIRKALAMGPTPGPFFVANGSDVFTALASPNAQGTHSDEDDGWHVADCFGGETFVNGESMSLTYSESKANAHLFAACDPDTIRALLDERDALQAENERMRKDAYRYQRLRTGDIDDIAVARGLGAMDCGMSAVVGTYSEEIDGDVLDAAIDAAMEKENKQ